MVKNIISSLFVVFIVLVSLEIGLFGYWKIDEWQAKPVQIYKNVWGMDFIVVIILTVFSLVFNNTVFLDTYFFLAPVHRIVRFWFIQNNLHEDVRKIWLFIFVAFWGLSGFLKSIQNWKGFPFQDESTTKKERFLKRIFFPLWWLYILFLGLINFALVSFSTAPLVQLFFTKNEQQIGQLYDYEHQGVVFLMLGLILQGFTYSRNAANKQNNYCVQRWNLMGLGNIIFWSGVYLICQRNVQPVILESYDELTLNDQNGGIYAFYMTFILKLIQIL